MATNKHTWAFAPRFRKGAFSWRSDTAITRIKEALTEIKAVTRKDARLGAEGAILFLQKLSPSLQNIDSSSGAMGSAVNRAIDVLIPILAKASVDESTRRKWLEQLYQAHADDDVPYIETLGNYWGELCASPTLAAEWADRLSETVDAMWRRGREDHGYFHGTIMCLSSLVAAARYEQLFVLLEKAPYLSWSYRYWGVQAFIAMGKKTEALRYAEASIGRNVPLEHIAETCENILLSSGLADEAYQRYAFVANQAGTYLASFRAICRKYPDKKPEDILEDLVASTPGDEGKWFAAAKDAKLYDFALKLAQKSPVDYRTLMRTANDFAESEPRFALNSGLMALYWICAGRGYDVTTSEVVSIYKLTIRAAEIAQCEDAVLKRLRDMLESFPQERFVKGALARMEELWRVAPGN